MHLLSRVVSRRAAAVGSHLDSLSPSGLLSPIAQLSSARSTAEGSTAAQLRAVCEGGDVAERGRSTVRRAARHSSARSLSLAAEFAWPLRRWGSSAVGLVERAAVSVVNCSSSCGSAQPASGQLPSRLARCCVCRIAQAVGRLGYCSKSLLGLTSLDGRLYPRLALPQLVGN